jgi:hypothetical protein
MMDLEKDLANPELEESGVWVKWRDGAEFKVARLGNKNFRRLWETKRRPFLKQIRQDKMPAEEELRISVECIIESVLLDWRGIKANGKALKYTPEIGVKYLMQSQELRNAVTEFADDEENFRNELAAESVGN